LIFSIYTQAAEGAIYGVVPYVKPRHIGTVAGIVGAGGNVGGVVFGLGFRSLSYRNGFLMMGAIVIASSFLSFFIKIYGHAGLVTGQESAQAIAIRRRHLDTINDHDHEADRNKVAEDRTVEQNGEDGASAPEIDEHHDDEETGAVAESPKDKESDMNEMSLGAPEDAEPEPEPEPKIDAVINNEKAKPHPHEE